MKLTLLVLFVSLGSWTMSAQASGQIWQQVQQPGHVVLLRHAIAPGTGDPANFELSDCATQRNLSQQGREQAQQIGTWLKAKGIDQARVYSSQWCRCMDTANLLNLGKVTAMPALNSFFQQYDRKQTQTRETLTWLAQLQSAKPDDGPLILVTHQVNITALTGIYPRSGEMIITRLDDSGKLTVLTRQVGDL